MPGFDGTGPRGGVRRGQGMGLRRRHGRGFDSGPVQMTGSDSQEYMYEYTLEELKERKAALEKEIHWIDDRMKEFDDQSIQKDEKQ